MNLYIGSGDVKSLLMGKETKGYQDLFRKFVSETTPYYNALASPIDALRTGAILEEKYLLTLANSYYPQVKSYSKEMDVFSSSLDFAKMEAGKIADFDELKTIWFTDFVELIQPMQSLSESELQVKIQKDFKTYYNQIQEQLYTTELDSCNLVFLAVMSYDDDVNYLREIKENEVIKLRIHRNQSVIDKIKEAGQIFQTIKNNFK
jgi:hypothetical protein